MFALIALVAPAISVICSDRLESVIGSASAFRKTCSGSIGSGAKVFNNANATRHVFHIGMCAISDFIRGAKSAWISLRDKSLGDKRVLDKMRPRQKWNTLLVLSAGCEFSEIGRIYNIDTKLKGNAVLEN